MITKWEYTKVDLSEFHPKFDEVDELNHLGDLGWELVGMTGHVAYLKKPIAAENFDKAAAIPAVSPSSKVIVEKKRLTKSA
jgi:hypothetical protein